MKWAVLVAAAAVSGPVAAIDPTEPPRSLGAPSVQDAQSVARPAWVRVDGSRSVAWYGGTVVRLGETVAGGRLVAIHEDHVVISGPAGRQRIDLLDPSVRVRHPPPAP